MNRDEIRRRVMEIQSQAEAEAKGRKPAPGSDEAIAQGCCCPILDNEYGRGGFDLPPGQFYLVVDCPLHGKRVDKMLEEEK